MNIRKRVFLLLAITSSWCVFASAQSPNAALTISENFESIPLEAALEKLESRYGLQLAYESKVLEGKTANHQLKALPLPQALEKLLQNTGLTFLIVGPNKVLIRPEQMPLSTEAPYLKFSGRVLDQHSSTPLPYASLVLEGGQEGTYTDDDGSFSIELPTEQLPITASVQYLGYQPKVLHFTAGGAGTAITILLTTRSFEFAPVTVKELPPAISSNTTEGIAVNIKQLSRLPGFLGGNDLMRQLQMLPGVSAHNDRSAGLEVRAGGEGDNLILLDGIPLFQADHFFGIFSALNTEAIEEARLYKNAFPAEYGGRTASILEVTGKSGLKQPFSGRVALNLLLANTYLSVPLSDKMSLSLSGRVTNKNVAESSLFNLIAEEEMAGGRFPILDDRPPRSIIDIAPGFSFYDTQGKWEWAPSKKSKWLASFFRSYDDFGYEYSHTFRRLINGQIRTFQESYQEGADWKNQGWNIQYERQWTADFASRFQFTNANFEAYRSVEAGFEGPFTPEQPLASVFNEQDNTINSYALRWKNDWQWNEGEVFTFGYDFEYNEVAHEIEFARSPLLAADEASQLHTAFAEYEHQWSGGLSSTLGLRGNYYQADGNLYFSPRLQLDYRLSDQFNLKSSLSRYHQFLRTFNFEDRFGRNFDFWVLSDGRRFPVAHSNQAMLGFSWMANSGWSLDVEFYAKKMEGVLTYALTRPALRTDDETVPAAYRLFRGEGRSYGVDMLLKRQWTNYSTWLAYTLSKTENRFPTINRYQYFPAQNDRRHQLKWGNLYRLGRWDFSLAYIFTSGKPYVDISDFEPEEDRQGVDLDEFIHYLDDYHRVDVGASYRFSLFGKDASVEASVFNLFKRENIAYRQFIFSLPGQNAVGGPNNVVLGNDLQLLERTFNLGVALEF